MPEAFRFSAELSLAPLTVSTEPSASSTVFPLARALATVAVTSPPSIMEPPVQAMLSAVNAVAKEPEARLRLPPCRLIMPIPG